jgi:ArsR family transcriptional regulator
MWAMEYAESGMEGYLSLAELFKGMAHPVRLRILDILARREACVCHLTCVLGMRQPYISQQLGALRDAGLVTSRRDGTLIYYRLRDARLAGLLALGQSLVEATGASLPPIADGATAECPCPVCQAASPASDGRASCAAAGSAGGGRTDPPRGEGGDDR